MAQTHYGGLIWTNHALERLHQRGLSQENALITFRNPEEILVGKNPGSSEFIRHFGSTKVTLIGKQNEKKEWIILSAWIDPPLPGSLDDRKKRAYHAYKKAPWWKKIVLSIKSQVGL